MLYRTFSADVFLASCRSWTHFRAAAAALPPERRTAAFLRLSQLLLKTAPLYRNVLDPDAIWTADAVPAAVAAKLKLPESGIDLVARTRDGDYWAVKTAFVAEGGAAPTRREVAAFGKTAFACRSVTHAMLIHDAAEDIAHPGPRTGQFGLADWRRLGQAGWRRILAAAKGRKIRRPAPKKPKPHQNRAVADARKHFRQHARGRLVMPCGTGKSLTGFLIAEALHADTVIVAAPSLSLIRQNLAGWAEEFAARDRTFDCICVCSDETVAGEDAVAEDSSGLGIEVTTDLAEIVSHLRRPRNRPLIVFSTYHSSPLLAEAARQAKFGFDLAVLDEAHKTVGAADRAFAALLDEDRIAIAKRLSMTATERVYRGDRDDVLSMDDEAAYGACFHQLTFKDAIAQGLICDYKIITFFIGEAEIRELIEQNASLDVDHEGRKAFTEAQASSLAAGIALKRAIRDYDVKHTISFHRSIRAADKFREQQDKLDRLRKLGPAAVNLHVSGAMPTAVRDEIMDAFAASDIGCVTNAKCLTEGIDVPRTDCILFEGPKQSVVDIAQAAGRAMRLFPGKKYGYIIVPVVVPEGMAFEDFALTTQFRKVAQTLTAMSTQDERLASEFRDIAAGRPPSGGGIVVVEGSDAAVGMEFAKFAGAIRAKVWRTMVRANWRPFPEARDYARSLGLKSLAEWKKFAATDALPVDVPRSPSSAYRDWAGWGDWLGTGNVAARKRPLKPLAKGVGNGKKIYAKARARMRPFPEARTFARSLGLKNVREWKEFARSKRMPSDIPNAADRIYADKGWAGWGDWLGTGAVADKNKTRRPFPEARAYVHTLGLDTKGWREFVKSDRKPPDIPSRPDVAYAGKGFTTYADWLGSKSRRANNGWLPFAKARAVVRAAGLKGQKEWQAWAASSARPVDVPSNPHLVYADWKGLPDWLGTGKTRR